MILFNNQIVPKMWNLRFCSTKKNLFTKTSFRANCHNSMLKPLVIKKISLLGPSWKLCAVHFASKLVIPAQLMTPSTYGSITFWTPALYCSSSTISYHIWMACNEDYNKYRYCIVNFFILKIIINICVCTWEGVETYH